jgi:hypothetical protein
MREEPEPSDAEVMAASWSDPPVFAALFDRHALAVYGYLDRRIGADRADDMLGEVFRVAFERRGTWRPDHSSARPWLFGIASMLVLRAHRDEGRRMRALARLAARASTSDDGLERLEEVLDARTEAGAVTWWCWWRGRASPTTRWRRRSGSRPEPSGPGCTGPVASFVNAPQLAGVQGESAPSLNDLGRCWGNERRSRSRT